MGKSFKSIEDKELLGGASTYIAGGTNCTVVTTPVGSGWNKSIITVSSSTWGTVAGAALGFGYAVATFPKGVVRINAAEYDLTVTAHTGCTINPIVGLGTVVASGAVTALNGTATFEDITTGAAIGALTEAVAKDYSAVVVTGENDIKDGRATAKTVYLNAAGNWGTSGTLVFTGTVTLWWNVVN